MKHRKGEDRGDDLDRDQPASDMPDQLAYPDVYPEMYPETEHLVPPEVPTGLDPTESPIVSDSPRRAMSPGRFGNPMKEKMAAQPENSDSPTDDNLMEPSDERPERDADFPDSTDPGVAQSRVRPRRKRKR